MTVPHRLTIVTLAATDFDAQVSFYKGLGFPTIIETPTFVTFHLGGVGLGIFPNEELRAEAGADGQDVPADWRGVTLATNVDEKEQVDEVFAAWVAAGARVIAEPEDAWWGGRSSYVADPEGNRWEIAWAPGFVFDEDGALKGAG